MMIPRIVLLLFLALAVTAQQQGPPERTLPPENGAEDDAQHEPRLRVDEVRRGVAVAAAWRGCHNVEEFMAQRRPACLTWILPDAAEETR